MDIVHFSLHFHWPGGAGRSTENGDRLSDSAITPMAMALRLAIDCRRSCSAILTWVLENVKISVRPLNNIGN